MGVKELTDLAIDPATGDYVYTSLKLSDGLTAIPKGYTKLNTLDLSNNKLGAVAELNDMEKAAIKVLFELIDTDGNGELAMSEIRANWMKLADVPRHPKIGLFHHDNNNKKVTLDELAQACLIPGTTALGDLGEIASLTDLNLASNNISLSEAQLGLRVEFELPSLPVLQRLNLASNLLEAAPPLASLPSLTSLDLSFNPLVSLSSLGQAAQLTKLSLRGTALSSTKGIGACSSLRTLDVGANQLTSLDDLSTLVALATLTVSSNQLTTLAGVESLPSLTTLDAGANQLADVAAAAALASVETLRAITIAGGGGDDEGAPPPNPLCDADNLKVELLALRPTLVTVDGDALLNAEKEEASALRAERAEAAAAAAAEAAAAEAAEEAGAAAE